MKGLLNAFTRLGLWLTIIGVGICCFAPLTNTITGFVLTIIALLYTLSAVYTANLPTGYNTHRECFTDIVGDLTLYSFLLGGIFLWIYLPSSITLPITQEHYYIAFIFLIVMTLIALIEMLITIRSSLIAMERQNPISIVRGE